MKKTIRGYGVAVVEGIVVEEKEWKETYVDGSVNRYGNGSISTTIIDRTSAWIKSDDGTEVQLQFNVSIPMRTGHRVKAGYFENSKQVLRLTNLTTKESWEMDFPDGRNGLTKLVGAFAMMAVAWGLLSVAFWLIFFSFVQLVLWGTFLGVAYAVHRLCLMPFRSDESQIMGWLRSQL